MAWTNFIVELIKATAWPITCLVVVRMFHAELKKLLERIKKGKVGSAEFEFEQELKELGEELPPDISEKLHPVDFSSREIEIAKVDPRSAIISAWLRVESAAFELAKSKNGYSLAQSKNPSHLLRDLERNNLIHPAIVVLFHELRALRNKAVHELSFNPSLESTLEYIGLSEYLSSYFEAQNRAR